MKSTSIYVFFVLSLVTFIPNHSKAQSYSDSQVKSVFNFVFGAGQSSSLTITDEDRRKANLFVKELTSKSCAMSYTETLTNSLLNPSRTVQSILKDFVVNHYQGCDDDIKTGKVYSSVKNQLRRNWKSAFAIRKQTGEW